MTALAAPQTAPASIARTPASSRLSGVTAIRGVAVAAVVVYHATERSWHWLPGGWAGVDVFFVLSGYLVERVLDRGSREDLIRRFYLRRWARLGPALAAVVLAAVLVAAFATSHSASTNSSTIPIPSSTPVHDYLVAALQTVLGVRALAMAGGDATAPALGHLWSLAIEAQFYLIWPLLFVAARGRRARCCLLAVGGAASALYPVFAYHGVADRQAVYFATATHLVGFALGALCYELRPHERLRGHQADLLLAVSLAGLLAIFCWLGEGTLKYQAGAALTALAASGVLVASCGRDARLAASPARPLVWLGDRSYGLYLWHFPLLAWLATDPGWTWAVSLVVALALADLSYRWLEKPAVRWARSVERG